MSGRPRLVQEGTPIYGPGSSPTNNVSPTVYKPSIINAPMPQKSAGDDKPKKRSSLQEAAAGLATSSPSSTTIGVASNTYRRGSGSSSLREAAATVRAAGGSPKPYASKSLKKDRPVTGRYVVGESPLNGSGCLSNDGGNSHDHMEGVEVHRQHPPPSGSSGRSVVDMDHEVLTETGVSISRPIQTSYVVGGGHHISISNGSGSSASNEGVQRMEGVIDQGVKVPLVVLDGANIAYAYSTALANMRQETSESYSPSTSNANNKLEPDSRGILIAVNYFLSAGLRVLVVLPAPWFRTKPRPDDANRGNAKMETDQLDILKDIKSRGLLVESPPADDDDAYALTIARREQARCQQRNGEGPGYVLSNDMFRDAINRDPSGSLREWLTKGGARNENVAATSSNTGVEWIHGPGRISYTFCDMGTMDDHGDQILDIVPNPRHPLVSWVEQQHHRSNSI